MFLKFLRSTLPIWVILNVVFAFKNAFEGNYLCFVEYAVAIILVGFVWPFVKNGDLSLQKQPKNEDDLF